MALGFAIVDDNTALQKKLDDANADKTSKMDAFKVAVNKFREGDKLLKITRGAVGKQACGINYATWQSKMEKTALTSKQMSPDYECYDNKIHFDS